MKRILLCLLSLSFLVSLCSCQSGGKTRKSLSASELFQGTPTPEVENKLPEKEEDKKKKLPTLYFVGDSTGAWYKDSKGNTMPPNEGRCLMGWGRYLSFFFDEKLIEPICAARSGSSSLSYSKNDTYKKLMDSLKEGDYLLIQFGHNDEKSNYLDRFTSPTLPLEKVNATGKDNVGMYSFQGMLYYYYVKPALDVGAHPVLISPIVRRDQSTGKAKEGPLSTYADAMEALATKYDILFIDMNQKSADLYEVLVEEGGPEATAKLHAFTDETRKMIDQTHLSHAGAYKMATLVADSIRASEFSLASYLLETPIPFDGTAE